MAILLGFLPFVAFALLSGVLGATGALLAGGIVSAALSLRSRLRGESAKILELGTLIPLRGRGRLHGDGRSGAAPFGCEALRGRGVGFTRWYSKAARTRRS
jgi:hypothetical protein